MWIMYAVLSALFASLTALFAKVGIKGVDSDFATAVRTVVILILTWGIVIFKRNSSSVVALTRNNLLFLLLSGVSTVLSWLFYFKAIQVGEVSKVAPIDKLSVALTMLLAFVFLKEPLNAKDILGGALIVIGTLVLIVR